MQVCSADLEARMVRCQAEFIAIGVDEWTENPGCVAGTLPTAPDIAGWRVQHDPPPNHTLPLSSLFHMLDMDREDFVQQ